MNFAFICEDGVKIGVKSNRLYVEKEEIILATFPLHLTTSLIIFGRSTITPDAAQRLYSQGANIICLTKTGKLKYFFKNPDQGRISLRLKQYKIYSNNELCFKAAVFFLKKKLNSALLYVSERYRNAPDKTETIEGIDFYLKAAENLKTTNLNSLRGIEGNAARLYFDFLKGTIKNREFLFEKREYHPAKDRFNCGISFCYGITRAIITTLAAAYGFDPFFGYLHSIADNKPSFALDVLEEFRPYIDYKFIKCINLRILDEECFYFEKDGSCKFTEIGLKKFLKFFYEEVVLNRQEPDEPYLLIEIERALKDFDRFSAKLLEENR